MTVVLAKPADLAEILQLEESFNTPDRWSRAMWAAELGWPDRRVVVSRRGHEVAGAAAFQQAGDVVDLHRIVVSKRHRRTGLARAMLDDGISWARCMGAERMLLEVDHRNGPALEFYRSRGFGEISRRRDYYGSGRDALVLELALHTPAPETQGQA